MGKKEVLNNYIKANPKASRDEISQAMAMYTAVQASKARQRREDPSYRSAALSQVPDEIKTRDELERERAQARAQLEGGKAEDYMQPRSGALRFLQNNSGLFANMANRPDEPRENVILRDKLGRGIDTAASAFASASGGSSGNLYGIAKGAYDLLTGKAPENVSALDYLDASRRAGVEVMRGSERDRIGKAADFIKKTAGLDMTDEQRAMLDRYYELDRAVKDAAVREKLDARQKKVSKYEEVLNNSDFSDVTQPALNKTEAEYQRERKTEPPSFWDTFLGAMTAHDAGMGGLAAQAVQERQDVVDFDKNLHNPVTYAAQHASEIIKQDAMGKAQEKGVLNPDLLYMTDDQVAVYTYWLETKGHKEADKYLDAIRPELQEKRAAQQYANEKEWAADHPGLASLASVGTNFGSAGSYLNTLGTAAVDADAPANPYNILGRPARLTEALREGARESFVDAPGVTNILTQSGMSRDRAEQLTDEVMGFTYDTGMSMADNVAQMAVFGEAMLPFMAATAAGQTAQQEARAGRASGDAAAYATMVGGVEYLTEKLPFERLIGLADKYAAGGMTREVVSDILKQAGVEGTEELASSYMDTIADIAIHGEDSEYYTYIRECIANGMTPEQAQDAANTQFFVFQPMKDFTGGAISGGVFAGGGVGYGMLTGDSPTTRRIAQVQQAVQEAQQYNDSLTNDQLTAVVLSRAQTEGVNLSRAQEAALATLTGQQVPQSDLLSIRKSKALSDEFAQLTGIDAWNMDASTLSATQKATAARSANNADVVAQSVALTERAEQLTTEAQQAVVPQLPSIVSQQTMPQSSTQIPAASNTGAQNAAPVPLSNKAQTARNQAEGIFSRLSIRGNVTATTAAEIQQQTAMRLTDYVHDSGKYAALEQYADDAGTSVERLISDALRSGNVEIKGKAGQQLRELTTAKSAGVDVGRSADSVDIRWKAEKNAVDDDPDYSEYDKPITTDDIETLRTIDRKSVNAFSSEDIKIAQKWAHKFWQQLGVKSPFFRAWFGDWRAYDLTKVTTVDCNNQNAFSAGKTKNKDMDRLISWGDTLKSESRVHTKRDAPYFAQLLGNIEDIVQSAVYLDTSVSKPTSDKKMKNTAFIHSLYSIADVNNERWLVRLYVEEALPNSGTGDSFTRAYEVKNIKKIGSFAKGVLSENGGLTQAAEPISIDTISDLFALVKKYDPEFNPHEVNFAFLNEDGTPKTFYHGTPNGTFTQFKNWQYFTESESYADVYQNQGASSNGYKRTANAPKTYAVYLTGKKVFDTRNDAEREIFEDEFYQKWGNGAPLSERGLPDWTDGDDFVEFFEENDYDYDTILLDEGGTGGYGEEVNDRGISVVVRDSNQIKSETDNIGTFNSESSDIRFQATAAKSKTAQPSRFKGKTATAVKIGEKGKTQNVEAFLQSSSDENDQHIWKKAQRLKKLGEKLGVTVVITDGVYTEGKTTQKYEAMYADRTVYVNADNVREAGVKLIGHEVGHLLAERDPAMLREFHDLTVDYVQNSKDEAVKAKFNDLLNDIYNNRVFNENDPTAMFEEYFADRVGDMFEDMDFLAYACGKKPTLMQRIADAFRRVLDMLRGDKEHLAEQRYLRKIEAMILDALGEYRQSKGYNDTVMRSTHKAAANARAEARSLSGRYELRTPQNTQVSDEWTSAEIEASRDNAAKVVKRLPVENTKFGYHEVNVGARTYDIFAVNPESQWTSPKIRQTYGANINEARSIAAAFGYKIGFFTKGAITYDSKQRREVRTAPNCFVDNSGTIWINLESNRVYSELVGAMFWKNLQAEHKDTANELLRQLRRIKSLSPTAVWSLTPSLGDVSSTLSDEAMGETLVNSQLTTAKKGYAGMWLDAKDGQKAVSGTAAALLLNPSDVLKTLSNNPALAQQLTEESPSIGRKLLDAIGDALAITQKAKENRAYDILHKAQARMLYEFSKQSEIASQQESGEKVPKPKAKQKLPEGVRFMSVQTMPDGTPYVLVDTDQTRFDGLSPAEMRKEARKVILEKFRGKIIGDIDKAFVNKHSAEEYSHSANRRISDDITVAKMRSSAELDNLMSASQYIGSEQDDGRHQDAVNGWRKYSVIFDVSGSKFKGEISLKGTMRGWVFYDLTKIENIAEGTSGSKPDESDTPASFSDVNNTIPQNDTNVKFSATTRDDARVIDHSADLGLRMVKLNESGSDRIVYHGVDIEKFIRGDMALTREYRKVQKLVRATNRQAYFYNGDLQIHASGEKVIQFANGFYAGNKIFINASAVGESYSHVFGHELWHYVINGNKALLKELRTAYKKYNAGGLNEKLESVARQRNIYPETDAAFEEFLAENYGDILSDYRFINHLIEKNGTLWQRIKARIHEFIDLLKKGGIKDESVEKLYAVMLAAGDEATGSYLADLRQKASVRKTEFSITSPVEHKGSLIADHRFVGDDLIISIDKQLSLQRVQKRLEDLKDRTTASRKALGRHYDKYGYNPQLMALHNLDETDLAKLLKWEAIPSPSIAVTSRNHNGFGDISLVFSEDTISPDKDSRNVVYPGDAYTPMVSGAIKNLAQNETTSAGDTYTAEQILSAMKRLTPSSIGMDQISGGIKGVKRAAFEKRMYDPDLFTSEYDYDPEVKYFESKPRRLVSFGEIKYAIVPAETKAELIDQLKALGINVLTYNGSNSDRARILNSLDDVKFSLPDEAFLRTPTDDEIRTYADEAVEEYGEIPEGENVNSDGNQHVPVQTDDDTRTRRTYRTVMESSNVPGEYKSALLREIVNGEAKYTPVSNKAAMDYANDRIDSVGYDGALEDWHVIVRGTRHASKNDMALGERLILEAIKRGDSAQFERLVSEVASEATRAGQVVQAVSMIKRLSPEGKLLSLQRQINNLNDTLMQRDGKKISIDDGLMRDYSETAQQLTMTQMELKTAKDRVAELEKELEQKRISGAVPPSAQQVRQAENTIREKKAGTGRHTLKLNEGTKVSFIGVDMAKYVAGDEAAEQQYHEVGRLTHLFNVPVHWYIGDTFIMRNGQSVKLQNANGYYLNGHIYLNAAGLSQAYSTTFGHELWHHIVTSGVNMESLYKMYRVHLNTSEESRFIGEMQEICNRYGYDYANKQQLIEAFEEYCAGQYGKMLSNSAFVDSIIAKNNTLWQKIKGAVKSFVDKLKNGGVRKLNGLDKLLAVMNDLTQRATGIEINDAAQQKTAEQIYRNFGFPGKAQSRQDVFKLSTDEADVFEEPETKKLQQLYAETVAQLNEAEREVDRLTKEVQQLKDKLDAQMNDMVSNAADQIPHKLGDMLTAWRYLAMLGNPRTHARNLAGNFFFAPAVMTKNLIAGTIEDALGKQLQERTKTTFRRTTQAQRDFALRDAQAMKDELQGGGKYNPADGTIKDAQKSFSERTPIGKALNRASDFVGNALEAEDWWFLRPHYVHALENYLTANGIKPGAITDEQLQKARAYAVREAQKATYRDANAVAEWLSDTSRKAREKSTFAYTMMEGIFPFKKTPMNIVKRGLEYSPVGLIDAVVRGGQQIKEGNMTATELIDKLSAGLTGTGIMALGVLLASLGMARGGRRDDDEYYFEKLQGMQDYSLIFGDTSYTIDWMAPVSLPFFCGVELYRTMNGDFSDATLNDIITSLQGITEPVFNLSMLDGLSSTLQSFKQEGAMYEIALNMFDSFVGQFFPTLGGQIARTIDPVRRNAYYNDKTSGYSKWAQNLLHKNMQKVPGMSTLLPEQIDNWGRVQRDDSFISRFLQNFLSPGYWKKRNTTDVDIALQELYNDTGDSGVFPKKAATYFSYKGETYNLSADEYVAFAQTKGQVSYNLINAMRRTNTWRNATPEQRVKWVEDTYKYATAIAKAETKSGFTLDGGSNPKWWAEAKRSGNVAQYIMNNR